MSAIRQVTDFSTWQPKTENVLDLRLKQSVFTSTKNQNCVIAEWSRKFLEQLTELYTHNSYISEEGFNALHASSPDLRVLCLCCARKTNDAVLEAIAKFEALEELNLDGAGNEAAIEKNKHQYMWCNGDPMQHSVETFTDAGIEAVLKNCKHLSKIDLSHTGITNKTLELIGSLRNLTVLRVAGCWNLKKEELAALRQLRPELTILEEPTKDSAQEAFVALKNGTEARCLRHNTALGTRLLYDPKQDRWDGNSVMERQLVDPAVYSFR